MSDIIKFEELSRFNKLEITNQELAIESILDFLQEPKHEGVADTPKRFLKALYQMTWGTRIPEDVFLKEISRKFETGYDELVMVVGINFNSLCEHHMLPFSGHVSIGYIPPREAHSKFRKVLGLSKLARLVEYYAARLQIQERLTYQIADALETILGAEGVGVVIEASHTCMSIRGIKAVGSTMVTSALRGSIRELPETRAEFLSLINSRK